MCGNEPPGFYETRGISWLADDLLASQEGLYSIELVSYHIHNSSPLVPIPIQINPVHAFLCYLLKIHFNIILSPMPKSSKCSLSLMVLHHNPVCTSPLPHDKPYAPPISFLITRLFGDYTSQYSLCNSNMFIPLLISFICIISLRLSILFFVSLKIIQILHFLSFQKDHTTGLQYILFSLDVFFFNPKISIQVFKFVELSWLLTVYYLLQLMHALMYWNAKNFYSLRNI
jgi:hypothetical protein